MSLEKGEAVTTAHKIMMEFAELTGLTPVGRSPRRYLWTDAFAVCNFLELGRQTGDEEYKKLALRLVDQVHQVLGRHREDDTRTGWISGLSEEEGKTIPNALIGGVKTPKTKLAPCSERFTTSLLRDGCESGLKPWID